MKLSQINGKLIGKDAEFAEIGFDSSDIFGKAYFCLRGTRRDGHDFAAEAEKNGAAAIVAERIVDTSLPQLIVSDARSALAEASAIINGQPQNRLKIIGITGTNGKTTTAYIIDSILRADGKKTGIIGTNGVIYDGKEFSSGLTTPDSPQLFGYLRDMAAAGVEYVIAEVSAHALRLKKTDGIVFDVAAFTNLSRDHLDFFKDMEDYAEAKAELFTPSRAKRIVINADDPFGASIVDFSPLPCLTYGCENPSDVFAIDLKMGVDGLEYVLNVADDIRKIKFSFSGRYNMYNSLCAAAVCHCLGVSAEKIAEGIKNLKRVDGRYNIINAAKFSVIIDFAHTEDGLRNIIGSVREYATGRIITVFGCGGDRDKTKRPLMGATAAELSDVAVITSDNPRSEAPEKIIKEIESGIILSGRTNYVTEPDRKKAIEYAFGIAEEGDVIILAGKGAEKYQEINGVKYPYSDGEFVLKLIEEREN